MVYINLMKQQAGEFFGTQSLLAIQSLYGLQREIKSGRLTLLEVKTFYGISTPMWQSLGIVHVSFTIQLVLILKNKKRFYISSE